MLFVPRKVTRSSCEGCPSTPSRFRAAIEYSFPIAPGGKLVYSTCSLEREENEDVVREVLCRAPQNEMRRVPGSDSGDGFSAAVIPSE